MISGAAFPGLQGRTLFFLHMPKAVGTSFRDLLARRLSPEDVLSVGLEGTSSITRKLANADRYALVHGHLPYAAVQLFTRHPFLFTVLRDPIERAISAFHFMKQHWPHMEELAVSGRISRARAADYLKAREMSLGDFIRNEPLAAARHLGNVQVELLTCADVEKRHLYADDYEIRLSPGDLDLAKERLAGFDAFGLAERLPESIDYLSRALKTRPLGDLAWCNKTRSRPAVSEIDDKVLADLHRLTDYDSKLYAFAGDLFEQRRLSMPEMPAGIPEAPLCPRPASFRAGAVLPGDGWYAAEKDGERWFHWTGPGRESWIELGSPGGIDIVLRIEIVHTLQPEFLHELEICVNGVRLAVDVSRHSGGHTVSARVPENVLQDVSTPNRVVLRLPRFARPCDLDPDNHDSRKLGIAVHQIELMPAAAVASNGSTSP